MKLLKLLLVLSAVLLLVACNLGHRSTMRPDFGNAVKTNMAVQTINPEAGQVEQEASALDGQKAEKALERYRKDKGKAPAEKLVTDIVGD
jgi:type IV pilus biogenesis protein CpaD/CtpE